MKFFSRIRRIKFNLDYKKLEDTLTLLIIMIIILEILVLPNNIFNIRIEWIANIFYKLEIIKNFLFNLAVLNLGLFLLARFGEN